MIRLEQEIALGIIGDEKSPMDDKQDDDLLAGNAGLSNKDGFNIEDSAATFVMPQVPEVLVTEEGDEDDKFDVLAQSANVGRRDTKKDREVFAARSDSLNEFITMEAEVNRMSRKELEFGDEVLDASIKTDITEIMVKQPG